MRERNLRHKPTEVTNSRNTEDLRLSRFVVHSITMGCPPWVKLGRAETPAVCPLFQQMETSAGAPTCLTRTRTGNQQIMTFLASENGSIRLSHVL
jgi:hypothetical protein